jgi:histone acetyltransferase (RNA polymerase elongator complex component)
MASFIPKPFIVPIFLPHSGCPHQCVFCNQTTITGASAKPPTNPDINSQITKFLTYKRPSRSIAEISFYGGNFLGIPAKRISLLLNETIPFIEKGEINAIRFSTRPDTIDKNRLNLIKTYTVSTIELGVQSMDDRVLRLSNRGHTASDTVIAVDRLKKKGYKIGLQMMTGLPGDTASGSMETAKKIIALKPDFVRIYPTLVLNKSPLSDLYREGRYVPATLEDCVLELKSLYILFQSNQIPVIRMGLQASKELDGASTVLAGPYHPALGHMVLSEIMLDHATTALTERKQSKTTVTLLVHPRSISRMQGIGSCNIDKIKRKFGIRTIYLKTDGSIAADEVRIG